MRRAALYVHGRVVVADSHLSAYESLSVDEKQENIVSGFLDEETGEFDSDLVRDHFYNKEIYLIRHGEVVPSQDPDPPITDVGREQAECIAKQLSKKNLSHFVCLTSPLLRCLQTASIFADVCKINFKVDLALIETPMFLSEHQSFQLVNHSQDFPNFDWPTNLNWIVPFESKTNFCRRVKTILQKLPYHSVLISHFGVITNMTSIALCNEKTMECGVPTASLTHIDNQEVKCLGWTCDI